MLSCVNPGHHCQNHLLPPPPLYFPLLYYKESIRYPGLSFPINVFNYDAFSFSYFIDKPQYIIICSMKSSKKVVCIFQIINPEKYWFKSIYIEWILRTKHQTQDIVNLCELLKKSFFNFLTHQMKHTMMTSITWFLKL